MNTLQKTFVREDMYVLLESGLCQCITVVPNEIIKFNWFPYGAAEGQPSLQIRWSSYKEGLEILWTENGKPSKDYIQSFCDWMVRNGYAEFGKVMSMNIEWES